MRRVLVGVQVADGDGGDLPLFDQRADGSADRILVERLQFLAGGVHAAGYAEPHALRHQRRRDVVIQRVHLRAVAAVATHFEDVLEAGIGQHPGHRTLAFEHGVEAQRGAMDETVDVVAVEAEAADGVADAGRGIAGRGEALLQPPVAAFDIEEHGIDKGAADIDGKAVAWPGGYGVSHKATSPSAMPSRPVAVQAAACGRNPRSVTAGHAAASRRVPCVPRRRSVGRTVP